MDIKIVKMKTDKNDIKKVMVNNNHYGVIGLINSSNEYVFCPSREFNIVLTSDEMIEIGKAMKELK
ncbi:MAG: hypothetical protein ACM3O3_12455 [Syntrophothermus sp.]